MALSNHIRHHERLGITKTFIYTTPALGCNARHALAEIVRRSKGGVAVFDLPWITQYKSMQSFHGNSGAQIWALNDCIHRAAAGGYEWSLNIDIDEFLMVNPERNDIKTITDLLIFTQKLNPTPLSYLSLGSHRSQSQFVDELTDADLQASPECARRKSTGAKLPAVNADLCFGWRGHRKHLVNTNKVFLAFHHHIEMCWGWSTQSRGRSPPLKRPVSQQCSLRVLNASDLAWLTHVNLTGWALTHEAMKAAAARAAASKVEAARTAAMMAAASWAAAEKEAQAKEAAARAAAGMALEF